MLLIHFQSKLPTKNSPWKAPYTCRNRRQNIIESLSPIPMVHIFASKPIFIENIGFSEFEFSVIPIIPTKYLCVLVMIMFMLISHGVSKHFPFILLLFSGTQKVKKTKENENKNTKAIKWKFNKINFCANLA